MTRKMKMTGNTLNRRGWRLKGIEEERKKRIRKFYNKTKKVKKGEENKRKGKKDRKGVGQINQKKISLKNKKKMTKKP
jgi:hypothetical protein